MKIISPPPILLILILFLFGAATLSANVTDSYRTFTDREGRSIRAKIVRTGPEDVWIRRDDGQTFQVRRSTLSDFDQRFISRWEVTEAFKAPNAIEFSVRRYVDGAPKVRTCPILRETIEMAGYRVILKNNTQIDLQNVEVEYRCFAWRATRFGQTGQNRATTSHKGFRRIAKLSPRASEEFNTEAIELKSSRARSDVITLGGRTRSDDLRGIWIRVRHDGILIGEHSIPSNLRNTESW